MTPITTQLPQAYFPPRPTPLRQHPEAGDLRRYERSAVNEQVIEAEWQSIPPAPAPRMAAAARAYAQTIPVNSHNLHESPRPERVSAHYRSMTPQPPRQRGLNIDTLA